MLEPYQQIKFVSGPFEGLLGKSLSKASDETWYVQVMIAGNPVTREVKNEEIAPLQ